MPPRTTRRVSTSVQSEAVSSTSTDGLVNQNEGSGLMFVAGATAGVVEASILYPLECEHPLPSKLLPEDANIPHYPVLKTQAQLGNTTGGKVPRHSVPLLLRLSESSPQAPSVISLARTTLSQHGARGFYSGVGALLIGTTAKAGARFLSYGQLKAVLADKDVSSWMRRETVSRLEWSSYFVVGPGEAERSKKLIG
ncbi:hypothetical protein P7C70_g4837, partial [Phenoliferia sp. Uapishka_3]